MISSGPKVSKAEIIAFFGFDLKLKWPSVLSSMWKISILKNICTGLVYKPNPVRMNGLWSNRVNSENKYWCYLGAKKAVMAHIDSSASPPHPLGT